ncbi:MAG: bifunctional 2-polyprenyl-6-hydroxyphenol methylase/3-demethylubiquinol 3-O-methyltransferase UbiG [Alphaproteobacteria bacterium]|nr:bifunctional 2-polyprenyl-6-hydroxyphenol methylase/3-demethylubiquinol 3-O-methyltransferase UbiG [Alphaproteobacteria bacterium]
MSSSTDLDEVGKFARLAEQWWDPNGSFASLHMFNPIRLKFLRDVMAAHFTRDQRTPHPFDGLSLLDMGCGGGLLSEPMSRLGFTVTGCDAGEANVRAAASHAQLGNLPISYRCATADVLGDEGLIYDVLLAMEIVEHVADLPKFIEECARLLRPGGLVFIATINKTLRSLVLAKFTAEYVLRWLPAGTHDWNRFVSPAELSELLEKQGLKVSRLQGLVFDPFSWEWRLSEDAAVNYIAVATTPRR